MNEREIFVAALRKTDTADRAAFLAAACGADAGLRERVEVLLREYEQLGSFLEAPATTASQLYEPEIPGVVIAGRYKLLEPIGEGGMGTVWMAQQTEPVKRLVAVKLIKPGMDSKQVVARFEAERQALAMMDHVNIAKILDGGLTQAHGQPSVGVGRPYFVMELVKGQPITKYCDEHHLTPRQRLELFVPVCLAVQHAHQKGIIHRDLKPSNVLVALYDGKPVPKVIDFGVAKATGLALTEKTLVTGFGALVGTLEYMSPEQAEINQLDIDTRTDIYSLGVLLYELLTGTTPLTREQLKQAAFTEMLRMIREEEPPRPSTRITKSRGTEGGSGNSERWRFGFLNSQSAFRNPQMLELDWIVMKALEKDRARRYETANGFAQDVQRYLADEPVQACPPSVGYRLRKFVRRHRGPVLAASLVLAVLVTGSVATIWQALRAIDAERQMAATERDSAQAIATEARKGQRERQRELWIQEGSLIRLSRPQNGRRDRALALFQKAGAIHNDLHVRSHAIGSLHGLDARLEEPIAPFGGSSVAWDPSGRQLGVGGLLGNLHDRQDQPAKLWDHENNRVVHVSSHKGKGPVGFRADGTLVQLIRDPAMPTVLLLWDVAKNQVVGNFRIPAGDGKEPHPDLAAIALSLGATHVAASTIGPDGKGMVAVWRGDCGESILKLPIRAAALAFSPDSTLLAAGDEEGRITVRSVPTGEEIAALKADRAGIMCLAMQRDRRTSGQPEARWLLAAGDAGGTVNVWDVQARAIRSQCRGSNYHVHAVAFSPDGMTLASGGRVHVKLWDIATGRHLLDLDAGNWITDVAFSIDGTRLAASTKAAFGEFGEVRVWQLEPGRGVSTLRGLASQVEKVWLSSDDRLVAGLSHDSRVAIWSLEMGQLLCVFELPKTLWADSCGGAFSPDNRQFAISGSDATAGYVKLWDVETGKELRSWTLPPGQNQILAFRSANKLLHFQVEELAGKRSPASNMDPKDHPKAFRIRDLADLKKPLVEITEFNWDIDYPVAPLDGQFVAFVGYYGNTELRGRQIKVIDSLTGKELWSTKAEPTELKDRVRLNLDRDGTALGVVRGVNVSGQRPVPTLFEMPSGKELKSSPAIISRLGGWTSQMDFWINVDRVGQGGQMLLTPTNVNEPVAMLGIDRQPMATKPAFDESGTRFAFGNADGSVSVVDIPKVRQELKKLGLDW